MFWQQIEIMLKSTKLKWKLYNYTHLKGQVCDVSGIEKNTPTLKLKVKTFKKSLEREKFYNCEHLKTS